jgi:DNA-directed RNA polymerase specialized sigma24 family protein
MMRHSHVSLENDAVERVLRSLRDRTFWHQCSLPTWVSVVAAHVAIDWVRSNSRRRARLQLVDNLELCDSHHVTTCAVQEELLEARSLLRYV